MTDNSFISEQLLDLLGAGQLLALLEKYGGKRLNVPKFIGAETLVIEGIAPDASRRLSEVYGMLNIRIPLGREFRATVYSGRGLDYLEIAERIGVKQPEVYRILTRARVGQLQGGKPMPREIKKLVRAAEQLAAA